MARLHGQAAHEPVERGLDEPRRSAWIALAQDVFDGVLATGGRAARPSGGAPAVASALLAAMDRVEDVLLSSMQDLAETLRGGREAAPGRELPEAQRLMEQAVEAVRGVEASGWALAADERADLLRRIDGLRRLCARQLALERWCSEWLAAPRA